MLFLTVLISGCSVRRIAYNDIITNEQIRFIQVGQTSMAEVVGQLGAPDEMAEADAGVMALYNWSDTKSAAIDVSAIAARFIPIPLPLTTTLHKTGIAPEQLMVLYDPQWTVRAYGFSRWPKDKDDIIWFWPF